MRAKRKPLLAVTAGELMTRNVVQIPEAMSLRDAARRLRRAKISGAPVVDKQGRCIGVLSAADFLRWAEEAGEGATEVPIPACLYQVKGRLLTGEEAVMCTLAEGGCPMQLMRPLTGGRHTALCLLPGSSPRDQQKPFEGLPRGAVRRYMTADVVTVEAQTPLPRLARMMIDAHIHRIFVVDEKQRPIGVVSSTDLLAALAYANGEQ